MQPRIAKLDEKRLVGLKTTMSVLNDTTPQLWKAFRGRIKELSFRSSTDFISLQEYPPGYFENFEPHTAFVKWACVEVSELEGVPIGMHRFILKGATYAVFDYKGASTDPSIFRYIYGEWLPASGFVLDTRPHFEVLGATYKHGDPNAEEEIWIPIRKR